ncbi:hypothetical protein diail_4153 [Diaporthe ilicicola]|nr:hypothetical protein diail_4153 [Diaporthe ilicicola]
MTQMILPNPESFRQDERREAVGIVLEDMQKYLPTALEPKILSAMRDYMVTELGRFPDLDRLLLRNASVEMLNKDAMIRLDGLRLRANDILEAIRNEGPPEEQVLRALDFSPESFLEATRQLAALGTRLVQCDAEFMSVRTLNDTLEQRLEQSHSVLRERDHELEHTRHILQRVETERDRSQRTRDYVVYQLSDLESRLRVSEKLRLSAEDSVRLLTSTLSRKAEASAPGAAPAVANGLPTATRTEPSVEQQQDRKPVIVQTPRSESRVADFFEELSGRKDQNAEDTNATMEQAPTKKNDAPVKRPTRPNQVIPVLPKYPPKAVIRQYAGNEPEEDVAKVEETGMLSLKAFMPKEADTSSKAENESEKAVISILF